MTRHNKKNILSATAFFLVFMTGGWLLLELNDGWSFSKDRIIDESDQKETVRRVIAIDSVWSAHPVDFSLYTHGDRQYIAYYNSNRNMVVGQRNLNDAQFYLHVLPPMTREEARGTSTILGWDSHNSLTLAVDREGFIHLAGNMHNDPITYFRSTEPGDISTLKQHFELVGTNEKNCTYPKFMLTREEELIFHYRDGKSGNGKEIYNIYSCTGKEWRRMLDQPLTDGQGQMNAYQSQPELKKDGWYHVYWVWRDSWDCSTNHDLSYMKSPDLKNWYDAFGNKVRLPATFEQKSLIVDPVPVKGGLMNLAARLVLDNDNQPVFAYHKYDEVGNLQFYIARLTDGKWTYRTITDWDYRWEFSGVGTIISEVFLKDFIKRGDGNYEITYWHIMYGEGALLLSRDFERIGEVIKPASFASGLETEGDFPGLTIRTEWDDGNSGKENVRYVLKWETLKSNHDQPREKPWPAPGILYLYELEKQQTK